MNAFVEELARLRASESSYKSAITQLSAAIADTDLGKQLADAQSALQATRVRKTSAEDLVRNAAVAIYMASDGKNKKPHAAVSIALYDVLDYDEDEVRAYALENLTLVLKLDTSLFEKVAKVLNLDMVSTGQEPRARIASNLKRYVVKEVEDTA